MSNVKYIECPTVFSSESPYQWSVFLAGGISNCHDWQVDIVERFKALAKEHLPTTEYGSDCLVLINPRRSDFDITNAQMSSEQIEWEHDHLDRANITLFWFPPETLCPITLFELGVAATRGDIIFVGCDPEYKRKFDVEKQLSLLRPEVAVVDNLQDLAEQVVMHLKPIWNL